MKEDFFDDHKRNDNKDNLNMMDLRFKDAC